MKLWMGGDVSFSTSVRTAHDATVTFGQGTHRLYVESRKGSVTLLPSSAG
jgi:hypothetical protein